MNSRHLAQINIGRLRYDFDDPRLRGFIDNLDLVNGLADRSPGFVWRLQGDTSGLITDPAVSGPRMAVNMSVWETPEALSDFVWKTLHKKFYSKKGAWFDPLDTPHFCMWWVPAGHRPTVQEAMDRLAHLATHGESERAFTWASLRDTTAWETARCA